MIRPKIKVKIGKRYYMADASAMTALRYRARFGRSLLDTELKITDYLDLLYVSIDDDDLLYHDFMRNAINEEYAADMQMSAIALLREILKGKETADKKTEDKSKNGKKKKIDEFYLIALASNVGLPFELVKEVGLVQLWNITTTAAEQKFGGGEPEKMSDDELLETLGINGDKLDEIEKYLEAHPEFAVDTEAESG